MENMPEITTVFLLWGISLKIIRSTRALLFSIIPNLAAITTQAPIVVFLPAALQKGYIQNRLTKYYPRLMVNSKCNNHTDYEEKKETYEKIGVGVRWRVVNAQKIVIHFHKFLFVLHRRNRSESITKTNSARVVVG